MGARLIALRPSPVGLLRRALSACWLRYRIREAIKDEEALQRQIKHDTKQADAYRGAIEAMRVELAHLE
ncbi:hypothetical protein [Methylibium sp.]|uniref:hypothetical protein n=1 Tax=Methylibium sp. TaxID=2067992 RepID=UPI003D0A8C6F